MVVVIALIEADTAAFRQRESGSRARSKTGRRCCNGVTQGHSQVQVLTALQEDISAKTLYVHAEFLQRESGARAPRARRLRPRDMCDRNVGTARAQLGLDLGQLELLGRQQAH